VRRKMSWSILPAHETEDKIVGRGESSDFQTDLIPVAALAGRGKPRRPNFSL